MSSSEPKRIRVASSSSSMQLRPRIEASSSDDAPRRKSVRIISRASVSPEPDIIRVRRQTVPAATEPTAPGTNPQANGSNAISHQSNGSHSLNPQANGSNAVSHQSNGSNPVSHPRVPLHATPRATVQTGDSVSHGPTQRGNGTNRHTRVSTGDTRVRAERGSRVSLERAFGGNPTSDRAEAIGRLMNAARATLYGSRDQPSTIEDMSNARRLQMFGFFSEVLQTMGDGLDENPTLINSLLSGLQTTASRTQQIRLSQQERAHGGAGQQRAETGQRGRASASAPVSQRRVGVREFFTSTEPIDLSQSPRAMSISSESTERTLSSDADSWGSSSEDDWSPRRDPLVTATQPIIENRDDESNLLNQPQLLHFIKHHTGRVKCSVCDDRIRVDQIRLDYRPGFRSAAVRHVHIACAPSNRDLFFPTRGIELISFSDGFTEEDKGEFLNTLRTTLPPQGTLPGHRGRLFPVVRNGDGLELSRVVRDNQRRSLESHRHYMRARAMAGGPLFMSTFGGSSFAGHMAPSRGLDPAVLASLPRVSITPPEPGQDCDEEEHSCVICLEPMLPRQDIVMLPCFHRYHEKCISTWLKNSRQCPMDKMDVGNLLRDGGSSQAIPSSFI